MAAQDLIYEFQTSNGVILDTDRIKATVTSLLLKTQDNKIREAKIGDFIKHEYSKIAEVFEFNKARGTLMKQSDVSTTSPLEFFEGYVNIISEIVKETSKSLAEEAKENRKKAEETVQAAKSKNGKAQSKYQNAREMDMNAATGRKVDREFVLKNYQDELENSEIALKNAEEKLAALAPFEPYKSSMDYFGISEGEAKTLIENQVNSATYINARRVQIATVGATAPVFMEELKGAFENVSYQDASAVAKRGMQKVYATKQVMKETLDSKKGFWGWVWKTFTHRTETKAMRNYINEAERALRGANFDEAAENEATEAMTKKGYFYGSYKASGAESAIKEKFAENEKKYVAIREERAKLAAMPIKDQFFEIKFRPSLDRNEFMNQIREFQAVRPIVVKGAEDKTIPDDVIAVFKATSKKLEYTKKQGLSSAEEICEDVEKKLMDKGNHDNYKGMKFSEVKALVEQKESVLVELENGEKNSALSKPIESVPTKEKEPPARIN